MIYLFTVMQLACPVTKLPPAPKVDTALFVYQDAKSTLKQHGDTVWSIAGARGVRIVDNGQKISIQQTENGAESTTEWCIRGITAFPLTGPTPPVPVWQLRAIRRIVEQAREGEAQVKRMKPPATEPVNLPRGRSVR